MRNSFNSPRFSISVHQALQHARFTSRNSFHRSPNICKQQGELIIARDVRGLLSYQPFECSYGAIEFGQTLVFKGYSVSQEHIVRFFGKHGLQLRHPVGAH
ncbi:MAG: hypothetical protein IPI55_10760 [Flavobacteriales bacterium]|nr:hypothetical protein [Flavobacteriales bacterium]